MVIIFSTGRRAFVSSSTNQIKSMKQEVFSKYVEKVSEQFGITPQEMFSRSKKREYVDARHLLFYLCSVRPMRLSYIQNYLLMSGYKTQHSSILHGIDAAKKRMDEDPDYVRIANIIQQSVTI